MTTDNPLLRALAQDPKGLYEFLVAKEARMSGSRSLAAFVKQAWHIFEPSSLLWGWHMDVICEHLEALARGQLRRLVVNVPPRSSKSNLASILFPAWIWSWAPRTQFMYLSYAATLSVEHSVKCRQVIESPWYRETHMRGWQLRGDQNVKHDFVNTLGGRRRATSIDGGIVGHGADVIVCDDPISSEDAYSKTARDRAWRVISEAISTRFNDPKTGRGLCIMQRFHEEDPAQRLIDMGWTPLVLPMEFETERRCTTRWTRRRAATPTEPARDESVEWSDPRQQPGDLLLPERVPREEVARIKTSLGAFAFASQFQQRPAPEGGGIFKVDHWRFWSTDEVSMKRLGHFGGARPRGCHDGPARIVDLGRELEMQIVSVDATFRETKEGSFVAIHVWGRSGADRLLLYRVHERMDFTDTVRALMRVIQIFPEARRKLIEGKANGDAIISALERTHHISGCEAVPVSGSKLQRAHAMQPHQSSGHVLLPDGAPWLGEYIAEHAQFPNGAHDDDVDAQSQGLQGLETVRAKARTLSVDFLSR